MKSEFRIILCAALMVAVLPAYAGPCTQAIAEFEKAMAADPTQPSGPQSVGAQLHHQPTPESVARADRRARADFKEALARAKHFDALGERNECMGALTEARLIYFE
jgi:hypothetical protein